MSQTSPVNAWDSRLALMPETYATLGTSPTPASTAAFGAWFRRYVTCDLGPAEVGVVRASKDRAIGRAMTSEYVQGRVQPTPFSLEMAIRSRSAIDVTAQESPLYKAAGLKETLTGATSAAYSMTPTPLASGYFAPLSLYRISGQGAATYLAETARGCVVEQLAWSGGDSEVMLKASGKWLGKYTAGSVASATVADGITTSITISAEESYRVTPGYYLWESEIILVTACTAGSTSFTCTRGVLSSTPAAHSSKQIVPYFPASDIAYTGSPLAETTATVTLDGIAFRCTKWNSTYSSGLQHLPGETGSAYVQGVKETRYDWKHHVDLYLNADEVSVLRKATARKLVTASISQGTGVGGVFTLASSFCEFVAPKVPDSINDVAVIGLDMRVRDNSGNDACTLTLT